MSFHFVGSEQERPVSAWRVKTSYLGLARKNIPSRLIVNTRSARDGL